MNQRINNFFTTLFLLLLFSLSLGWTPAEIKKRLGERYTSLEGEVTLKEALDHIQRGSGVPFICDVSLPSGKESVEWVNLSLKEALEKILTPRGLTYRVGKKGVYILSKTKAPASVDLGPQEETLRALKRATFSGKGKENLSRVIGGIFKSSHLRLELRFLPPARDKEISYDLKGISCFEALKELLEKQKYHFQIEEKALVISSFRPPTPEEVARGHSLFEEAQRDLLLGKLKEGMERLEQSVGLNRSGLKARSELARWKMTSGQYSSAQTHLSFLIKSLSSGKEKKEAQVLMAYLLAVTGQSLKALDLLSGVLTEDESFIKGAFAAGEIARQAGLLEKSNQYFQKVIDIYQNLEDGSAEVYGYTGGACYFLNRLEDAPNMFNWALEKEPFHQEALYYQGLTFFKQKQFEKGKKALVKLINKHPFSLKAHLALARGALLEGLPLEAKKHLQKVLSLNPSSPEAFFLQGQIALKENNFSQASGFFGKALKIKADYLEVMVYQAACYSILKDDKAFRLTSIRILKMSPKISLEGEIAKILRGRKMGVLQEAQVVFDRGLYREARKAYEEALKKDPQNDLALLGLARVDFIQGNYRGAQEKSLKIMAKAPQEWEAFEVLIQSLQRQGKHTESVDMAQKALKSFPGNPNFYTFLGQGLALLGRYQEAKKQFSQALQVGDSLQVSHLLGRARAQVALNQPHQANEHFYKVEELSPSSSEGLCDHALLFIDKYDYGYGMKLLKKLFSLNPHYPRALVALARCQMEDYTLGGRRYLLARKNIEKALSVNPNLEEALLLKCQLSQMDGNYSEARKIIEKILTTNSRSIEAYGLRGVLLFLEGKKADFEKLEKEILSINPLPSAFYALIADLIGDHFLYEEASQFAGKAVKLNGENWQAYTTLGLNLLRVGEEDKGKEILEIAHKADKFNVRIFNTLELLDDFGKKYKLHKIHPLIQVRVDVKEEKVLLPYAKALLEEILQKMGPKYGYKITRPLLIEFFSSHQDFSVRTMGLPHIGALGVCFGRVVVLDSPLALQKGQYNWGRTLWHEFVHVITLALTKHRIPRWFTEGISVYEETQGRSSWDREYERRFLQVFHQGQTRGILALNEGFTRPRYGDEVLVCYFQGGLVVEFIAKKWGFKKILAMLEAYGKLFSTDRVLKSVLGITPKEFDRFFSAFVGERFKTVKIGPFYSSADIDKYREEADQNPKSAPLWTKLALAYIFSGQMVDGEIALGKALALNPEDGDGLAAQAFIELSKENFKGAREYFEKALKNKTTLLYKTHGALAGLYLREKNKAKGLYHLEEVLKLYPRDIQTLYKLVGLYESTGKKEKALKVRETIVEIQERDLVTRQYLLKYYRAKGNYKKVIELGKSALMVDPYNQAYHVLLAQAYSQEKNYREALQEYEILLSLLKSPSAKIYVEMARLQILLGKKKEAGESLNKALEIDPNNQKAKKMLEGLRR